MKFDVIGSLAGGLDGDGDVVRVEQGTSIPLLVGLNSNILYDELITPTSYDSCDIVINGEPIVYNGEVVTYEGEILTVKQIYGS